VPSWLKEEEGAAGQAAAQGGRSVYVPAHSAETAWRHVRNVVGRLICSFASCGTACGEQQEEEEEMRELGVLKRAACGEEDS
jgi:hypothetical protein